METKIKNPTLTDQTLLRTINATIEVNGKDVPMVIKTEEDYEHGVVTETNSSPVDVDQWNSLSNDERSAIKSIIEETYS